MKDTLYDAIRFIAVLVKDPLIDFCAILLVIVTGSLIHWYYGERQYRKVVGHGKRK